jgi:hypothetical protein
MVLANLIAKFFGDFTKLWQLMRVEHESLVYLVWVHTVPISLEADVLLVEVKAIDCMGFEVAHMMFLAFVCVIETDKVIVLLQLTVFLQGNCCNVDILGRCDFYCSRFKPILQFSKPLLPFF